jgi:5-methylcytosine-specific restriction endonuclease McrA
MNEAVREQVRQRAGGACEYCGAHEGRGARLRFHIEHIIAHQHGGGDELENLALACHLCNAHKGPNLTGIDPNARKIVSLFHPRRDRWKEHFANVAGRIIGRTSTGRATVAVLNMNHSARIELRLSS